jgi:tetratricopeptide (TPR) repeat protein
MALATANSLRPRKANASRRCPTGIQLGEIPCLLPLLSKLLWGSKIMSMSKSKMGLAPLLNSMPVRMTLPCCAWVLFALALICISGGQARAQSANSPPSSRAAQARSAYENALNRFHQEPQDSEAAWQFARTCFDLADFAANKAQRARIARQGIAAGQQAATLDPNSAPAHYYIGMDMGQLARTKTFGALRLVRLMRTQFEKARSLDEKFDYAGPDRNLGLLYRDAPSFLSIGSRTKARRHLERAVALAPTYPENRLDLIDSLFKWGKRDAARHELQALDAAWPEAHKTFAGTQWAASWADWNRRLQQDKRKLNPQ